jgi:pimeloyl-ACP methyl ester carboxylesterase
MTIADVRQATVTPRTFHLSSGRVEAELSGAPEAPLVIGIPGLSANLRSFDHIFTGLDPEQHRMLAYDPRGRGRSETTPPGTYGWDNHAGDIIEMADQLGAASFDLMGWSMGTWIAMRTCQLYPGRVRRLVLIDGGGIPDEEALVPIYAGLKRLETVFTSFDEFAQLAEASGIYHPWSAWEAYFRYEFRDVDGGVQPQTTYAAPWEDECYRKTQDSFAQWPAVTMPALLVRATREIVPGHRHILTAADAERFLREVPTARLAEVDATHYSSAMHPDTVRAIAGFLGD